MVPVFLLITFRRIIMSQTTNTNYFAQLAAVNVNEHIEKKGQFNYLSWPYAVSQLRMFDEHATWKIERFEGLPFLTTDYGTFVEVAVTVKGVTLSQLHPVLDSKYRPLLVPSAFDINTSIQRCLVKAIALHGLGLSVYAGEDVPHADSGGDNYSKPASQQVHTIKPAAENDVPLKANQLRYIKKLVAETSTDEVQLLGFFGFDSLEAIPKSQVNRVISTLEANRKEAA
jgi:hypothetical protein